MKNRTPTLMESLGDYAAYGLTIKKPNRRNIKSWKLKRKICTLSRLKEAA